MQLLAAKISRYQVLAAKIMHKKEGKTEKNEERKLPPFEDEMTTHIEKLKDCTKEDILGKS